MPPLRITRERARAIDRAALVEFGIPSIVLMEHAGRSAAELVLALARAEAPARPVTIFCGGGNNGGDGFVVARWLDAFGVEVECVCAAALEDTRSDALLERKIARAAGLVLHDAADSAGLSLARDHLAADPRPRILVDALLGTGFEGHMKAHLASAIEIVNACRAGTRALVVSIDLPSGLDCDRGVLADPIVRADFTATFVAEKTGFADPRAQSVLGRVVVLPIGIPRALLERLQADSRHAP